MMASSTTQIPVHESTKKAGPGLWPSLLLIAAGLALMSWGAWTGVRSAAELLFADSFETPGSQTRDLEPGEYEIYGLIASVDIFDFDVDAEMALPSTTDITVTEVGSGRTLEVAPKPSVEALGRQSNVYERVGEFIVTESGRYEVSVTAPEPSRALFGRTFESFGDRIGTSILLAVTGLVLTILGIAMLIAGLVRRKRQRDRERGSGPTYGVTPGAFTNAPSAPPPAPPPARGATPTSPSTTDTPTSTTAPPPNNPDWPT